MSAEEVHWTQAEISSYYAHRVPDIKQSSSPEWRGPCPIHHGERDSFAVDRETGDWYCHSQCGRGGSMVKLEMLLSNAKFGPAKREVLKITAARWRRSTYIYQDENGLKLYRVVRRERGVGAAREKDFFQERYDEGKWVAGLGDVRRVPYRLNKLVSAKRVFIVEGEKDVKNLELLGLIASTSPMGAGKWRDEYARYFNEKHVVIIPDNDKPGREHALTVALSLIPVASTVHMLELPNLPEKGDVSDWVQAGGTLKKLEELARSAPLIDQSTVLNLHQKWSTGARAAPECPPVEKARAKIAALQPDPDPASLETALRDIFGGLQDADSLQREVIREACLKKLREVGASAPARLVEAAMSSTLGDGQKELNDGALTTTDIVPWPHPVDGASLLVEVTDVLRRFVILQPHEFVTVGLWIVHTYVFDAFECSPFLQITSPEKRCGKTRLLSLLNTLVSKPLPVSNITPAAVFRTIEALQPCLLIDEADTFLNNNDELRGILNSGHTRDTAFVIRLVGDEHEPKRFTTWCPKAVALIGKAPPTIEDRSIFVRMRRKTDSEKVEKWNRTAAKTLENVRRKIARWAVDNLDRLQNAAPEVPELGNDRAEDNWLPLLAIAELIGGDWIDKARQSARQASRGIEDDESHGVQLLGDLRVMFTVAATDRLSSESMVRTLAKMEHRPWPEWKGGKPITTTQLAALLKPFGIRPRTVRLEGATPKGYKLADFDDAFRRYLPCKPPQPPHTMKSSKLSKR